MMTSELRDFFQKIWGDDAGERFVSTAVPGKPKTWKDRAFRTNEEAAAFALAEIEKGKDVFFGTHLFDGENRKAANATGCRALYFDIDIPKCYESKEATVRALKTLLDNTGLPTPTIADSGNGLHLYWIFREMLSESEWDTRCGQINAIAKAQGLKVDESVTTDRARVLRVPGSFNRKNPDEPKPCRILKVAEPAELDTVAAILDKHAPLTFKPEDFSNDKFLAGIETSSQDAREVAWLCLPFLSVYRCDDYSEWLNVGIALYNTFEGANDGLQLWDEWSKRSKEYQPGVCAAKWESFTDRPHGERIEVGSLVVRAKADSDDFSRAWEAFKFEKRSEALAARANKIELTDLGNAQRLVALYGQDIRYDFPRRTWYAWTGKHWKENADAEVMQFAKATVKAMYAEAAKLVDDMRRQKLAKHAHASESVSRLQGMIKLAESEAEIQAGVADFDIHPHLLCAPNGVVDLRSGKLRPHDRELMLSKCIPIRYDPAAKCPLFDKFLGRIFAWNRNLIEYIIKALGYTLTAETSEQVFFICYGEGANGKSTLIETMQHLLGDLAGTVRTEALMQSRFAGNNSHSDDIANLHGKRFVSAVETESGQRLAESAIKQLTGGDVISASRKYGRAFKFPPFFKLFLAANHKPQIAGTDEGIWRRIRLIPFTERIPEHERDPNLKEKLRVEAEGIFAKIVRGAVAWYAEGLGAEPDVIGATTAYRSEQDTVENFIRECCEVGPGNSVVPSILYENYRQWCSDNGVDCRNRSQFPAELEKRGLKKHSVKDRGMSRVMWQGIGIRSPFAVNLGSEVAPI
jgi:putative DNA primase/helicase